MWYDLWGKVNDPTEWNTHLLQSLDKLVDAPTGLACTFFTDTEPAQVRRPITVYHGMDDGWKAYTEAGDYRDQPETPAVIQRFGTDWTCTRRELVDDATWYASSFYARIARPGGTDDHILSQVNIAALGRIHHIAALRPPGAAYFDEHDVAVIQFLHAELARLWRKPEAAEVHSLPKRLQDTLTCIRRGMSRKETAGELDISPHTVHDYERQLFEKFEVQSRGELLARLARAIRPALPK